MVEVAEDLKGGHYVKSVQIRSFFGKSPYSVRIQENADQIKLRIWTLFYAVGNQARLQDFRGKIVFNIVN